MENILKQIIIIVKLIGREAMLELVKSTWVKVGVGFSIMAYPMEHLVVEIIKALR